MGAPRVVVVGGGSQGVGRAAAIAFAAAGAERVVLLARRQGPLDDAAAAVNAAAGGREVAVAMSVDLSDWKAVSSAADAIKRDVGVPDVVVCSACRGLFVAIDEVEPEEIVASMASTYFAAFFLVRAFIKDLLRARAGSIVIVGSPARFARFFSASYVASRRALHGLVDALRLDLRGSGIRVFYSEPLKLVDSAYFDNNPGAHDRLPWFYRTDSIPFLRQETREVGDSIVAAVARGWPADIIPFVGRAFYWLYMIAGPLIDRVVGLMMLPPEAGGPPRRG